MDLYLGGSKSNKSSYMSKGRGIYSDPIGYLSQVGHEKKMFSLIALGGELSFCRQVWLVGIALT